MERGVLVTRASRPCSRRQHGRDAHVTITHSLRGILVLRVFVVPIGRRSDVPQESDSSATRHHAGCSCVRAGRDDAAPDAAKPQTGAFQLSITERSKFSAIATIVTRMGWGTMEQVKAAAQKDGRDVDYNLSGESFEAFVPEEYTGAEPYGLIVWISPGPGGRAAGLARRAPQAQAHLGRREPFGERPGEVGAGWLAIDAAEHMKKAYKIDPLRVYLSARAAAGGSRA